MDKINKLMEKNPFSTEEIVNLCKGKVNVITYKDLEGVKNIDQILKPWNACIILFETKEHFGHWTAILKYKQDKQGHTVKDNEPGKWAIEYFDSYGMKPDDELDYVPDNLKSKLGEDRTHLTKLLLDSGYPIIYNKIPLQEMKGQISTCGRWVGARVNFRHIDLGKFCKAFLNQKMSPDEWITAMTSFVDNKRPEEMVDKGSALSKKYSSVNRYLFKPRCPTCVH
jgi:hypothetical protein